MKKKKQGQPVKETEQETPRKEGAVTAKPVTGEVDEVGLYWEQDMKLAVQIARPENANHESATIKSGPQ